MSNNEEMALNYTKVLVYCSFTRPTKILLVKALPTDIISLLYKNQGKYLYQFCAGPFEEEEKKKKMMEKSVFAISRMSL